MPNDLDRHFALINNASAGIKLETAQNGVTAEGLKAQGDAATQQQAISLMEKQMQELMQPDPSSTLSQPGGGGPVKYVVKGLPRTLLKIPNFDNDEKACYSDSPWTQYIRPAPLQELDVSQYVRNKQTLLKQPMALKYPPDIPNFPIKFDRMLGYKEFFS